MIIISPNQTQMKDEGRVITTDFKLVKVCPVAYEADEIGLCCAAVDSEGKLYKWGVLRQLGEPAQIINQCWDNSVSDKAFLSITKKLYKR